MRTFFRKVNRNDRAAMVGYLIDHDDHDGYFSNTIKVHSLGLTREQRDLLAPFFELGDYFTGIFTVMLTNLGAEAFLNLEIGGRMGGHVELRNVPYHLDAGYYLEMPLKELRAEVKLIQKFDQICDKFLAAVLDFCQHNEVVEEEHLVRKTVKVIQERAAV